MDYLTSLHHNLQRKKNHTPLSSPSPPADDFTNTGNSAAPPETELITNQDFKTSEFWTFFSHF